MKVLIACEFSGIVREAFRKRGHNAWSCDLLPTEIEGQHIQKDILEVINNTWDEWDLMIAHPPCTYLCVSGAQYWKDRQKEQREGVDFFMFLATAPIPRIAIENPVGIISTVWRKPDQYIHPYYYGHPISKKTGLWLKNLPKLYHASQDDMFYKKTDVEPEWIYYGSGGRASPDHYKNAFKGKDRSKERSRTYLGIAEAMANQWGNL